MIVSEARISANRANAQKSTGPKTEEGKERSRANSFQHGMTGAGIVLPAEDLAEVERRAAGLEAQFGPVTEAGRSLVRRAAVLSVRIERSVVQESAAISLNVRAAEGEFDESRMAEVDRLMKSIAEEPAASLRKLRRMPEGVDRLIATWSALRSDLAHPSGRPWTADHHEMAENLIGRSPGDFGTSRIEELSRAIRGDFSFLGREDGANLAEPARRDWARREMIGLVDAEVARLRDHRETLDLGAIEADRAGSRARALFDPSKAATLARKYEAAAERGMYRALREMKEVEAAHARSATTSPARGLATADRLGSFSPPPPATPPPSARPVPMASTPTGRTAQASQFEGGPGYSEIPMAIGRAR